jgi:flagellar biosynthesis/type III secretory pathway M-ring protein FliF/YscJ
MEPQRMQRLRRIVAGDDNPLRRNIDKLESAVMAGLVIAFLVAAPLLAVAAVRIVSTAGAREVAAQSSWRPERAELTQNAAAGIIGLDGEWDTSWVTARWTAPDGATLHGLVAVGLNAKAGQTVEITVTETGQPTTERLSRAGLIEREALAAVGAPAALAALLAIVACAVRAAANRRRMGSWTKAWDVVGPRWSSRR